MTPPVTPPTSLAELVDFFLGIINGLIPLLFGIVFLVIIWKIIDAWVIHADDSGSREEGRTVAITGVVVIVIMVSIWGILNLLKNSLV